MRSILFCVCVVLATGACQPSAQAPEAAPVAASMPSPPQPPVPEPPTGIPASTTPPPQSDSSTAEHWQCGEVLLDARLDGETMHLDFSGRMLALPHVESLTGARYADTAGNAFMRQGDGAKLILSGDDGRDCSRSEHTSPWIEAAARGVAFRAVGSEPGWFVGVGKGESPPLHATLDYGDRKIDLSTTQSAGAGYSGTTVDGVQVALKIQRAPCHDGMSGEAFEATAQLVVGDKTYHGCGAFLTD